MSKVQQPGSAYPRRSAPARFRQGGGGARLRTGTDHRPPLGSSWDSFFLDGPSVSADFLAEHASQEQADRDAF
jgi:hypothetical protein